LFPGILQDWQNTGGFDEGDVAASTFLAVDGVIRLCGALFTVFVTTILLDIRRFFAA
jgi:hypothetical protein